ncbi:YkgB family protein [Dyella flava]|uniref:DUF417 family protein n=1 Tax=Dyella flava TaxID=1920170 RepID=A0ABS2K2I0_9GAMM|nr:DUF417 family protein [Dyella flava]MBM7124978.1 DUF417 family protein [Dyella flava]GLQ49932.1 hypothetical protein GCM10010872_13810 [Dyella flava]
MSNVNLQKAGPTRLAATQAKPEAAGLLDEAVVRLSNTSLLRGNVGYHIVRAAMVFTFLIFGYQKWFNFEVHQIEPLIQHSPVVFWLIPAFGLRGAGFFLGTTEWLFGSLIFLGFWSRRAGILGALGSIVTFIGTVTIIPFLPDAWATEAGGFPLMHLPVAFLMKDILYLAVSFYLFQQDLKREASVVAPRIRRQQIVSIEDRKS